MAQGDARTLRDTGPAGDVKQMSVGTVYTQGRAFLVSCTTAGTLSCMFPTGNSIIVSLAQAGVYEFNWAITEVTGATATGTFWNLY